MIQIAAGGVVYRNPKPYLRAIHTWHPTLVRLDDGGLLAGFDLGQAAEALDYCTYLSRSADEGLTWSPPTRVFQDTASRPTSHTVRLGRMADGEIVACGGRFYRDDPDKGILNHANLGYYPMDMILLRSRDGGRSWSPPETIQPPLVGPGFEVCHRVLELRDGRWLLPVSTWRGWDGAAPNGMRAIALVSHDRGRTWPECLDIMDDYAHGVIYWEQSIVELTDGRLLAVAWAFHEPSGKSRPNDYVLSADGKKFSRPRPTGLVGETAKMIRLEDGRIYCLYRRSDRPGLWANMSRIEGDRWVNLEERPVWQGASSGLDATSGGTPSDELAALKFGFPSMIQLPDGNVIALFWCHEEGVNNIRWVRFKVT